jgi:uncharacterized membrane protein YgcG
VKRTPAPRALTFLGATLLVLAVVEACSNGDDTPTSVFNGPPSIAIGKHVLSPDTDNGTCGKSLDVTLAISNWLLKEPGLCESTPQCGQVRVAVLKDGDRSELAYKVSASAEVELSFDSELKPGVKYEIEAELIDDAGNVFTITDAGSSLAQAPFTANPPTDCPIGATSEGGAGGLSGFGGAPPDGGAGGSGGSVAGSGGS